MAQNGRGMDPVNKFVAFLIIAGFAVALLILAANGGK